MRVQPRRRDDHGTLTLFVVVIALSLMMFIGLVVDGGGRVRALQRANTAADEAARAGGQMITESTATRGDGARLDAVKARIAAQQYLAVAGVEGRANLDNGTTLRVRTTATYRPVFLGLIGIGEMTMEGESTVRLVQGVEGNRP